MKKICLKCNGTGEVELPVEYAETLKVLVFLGGEGTTVEIERAHEDIKRTALLNRLNKLVQWGIVEKRGMSQRGIVWKVI